MASAVHNVLQAMDNLANAPFSLAMRLTQPAPPGRPPQTPAALTPPKVVKRKRRLTLPLEISAPEVSGKSKWFSKPEQQRTCDQRQSPLMRLPAELRAEIWSLVILGEKHNGQIPIHWRSSGGGKGSASASTLTPPGKDRNSVKLGVLGMLRSCRVIYSEAIDLLYSLPVFTFSCQSVETLLAFTCAIPQHRRDQIRHLDLTLLTYYFVSAFASAHSVVLQKPELRRQTNWSYKRISDVKALSELPDARNAPREEGIVHADWIIDGVLKTMKGLDLGGVKRGPPLTDYFAQSL